MIDAGKLDKRITLETFSTASDTFNQKVQTWTTWATTWASIEPKGARERFAANQVQNEVSHIVTIRWRDGVSTKMRVRFGSRTFRIEGIVDERERHEQLVLMCVELAS